MANNKQDNRDELSVDELVNKLKNNISSPDAGTFQILGEESPVNSQKKSNPDKDIASMLKRIMPDEKTKGDAFELDEDDDFSAPDFELESESEQGNFAQITIDDAPVESGVPSDNTFDIDDFSVEEDPGVDNDLFEEPIITDEENDAADVVDFPSSKETPLKNKKRGLFGFGKGKSLADGYAELLENDEVNSDISVEGEVSLTEIQEGLSDNTLDFTQAEMPDFVEVGSSVFDTETESSSEEQLSIPYDDQKLDSLKDEEIGSDVQYQKEDDEPAVATTQLYMFDEPEIKTEQEEEYFVAEKNPLAFDNESETPVAPDEAAFNSVVDSSSELNSELFESETELDDKDIDLMVALGYEDELEKIIGKKKVEQISDDLSSEIVDFIDIDNAYAFDGVELTETEQFRNVGNKYKQEHYTMRMRLVGTAVFTLALLLFETLGSFGITFGGALNIHHYPVVCIMLSLQLLVLGCALSWRQLLDGLRCAVTFYPSPASIPATAVLATVIYDIVMALIAPNSGLYLYNFPAALCLVFLVLNDYFNLEREIRAFNTIATKKQKYSLSVHKNEEDSPEAELEAAFSDDESDEIVYREKIIEVEKTDFIENYFRRSNIVSKKKRSYNLVIYPFIALAVILGIVSFVTSKSGLTAFNVSILTVLFGMPMSTLFIYSYPFFSAVKIAFEAESTIIGEESVEQYSDASSMVFADTDVFLSDATVTKGLRLYDNNAIYDVLYNLTSLYSKIGGPLKERLEQATVELGHSEDVSVSRVEEKGVEALVDGKTTILAGKAEFMTANGIEILPDLDDEEMLNDGCACLYVALDGVLTAKLYVQYNINSDFDDIINDLASERVEVVVKTCDPNIDIDLLSSRLTSAKFSPKIERGASPDEVARVYEKKESGIVSRGSLYALARAVVMCNRIQRIRLTSKTVSTISMVVSIAVMVFLALFSTDLKVASIYVALYQLFWMIPMLIFTKLNLK